MLYVLVGVAFLSTSPVLTRLAAPYSAAEITFARMAVAAVFVAPLALLTGSRLDYSRAEAGRLLVYGLITAAHFLLYIWSLQLTTIAHALALVYTAPIFVTLFSTLLLGEHVDRRRLIGVPVAVAGVAVLTGFEPALDGRMLVGDMLAVGSAIAFGLYSVAGRRERDRQPLLRYAVGVYGAAALWLLPVAVVAFSGWQGVAPAAAIVALGVFPLGIGHTLYNASLRRAHPTFVNLIATQEVTGGIILGAVLLGEIPSTNAIVGAALTLIGVAIVLVPRE